MIFPVRMFYPKGLIPQMIQKVQITPISDDPPRLELTQRLSGRVKFSELRLTRYLKFSEPDFPNYSFILKDSNP